MSLPDLDANLSLDVIRRSFEHVECAEICSFSNYKMHNVILVVSSYAFFRTENLRRCQRVKPRKRLVDTALLYRATFGPLKIGAHTPTDSVMI